MATKSIFLWTISGVAVGCMLLFGSLWMDRLQLEYNAEGRYYDELAGVVYDQSAVMVYGIITVAFMITAIITGTLTWRARNTNKVNTSA